MDVFGRLRRGPDEATRIAEGEPLTETERWTASIPGYTAHFGRIHAPSHSLFVADGWGVTFSSLRFRRFDLRTGAEVAAIRTGTAVRCYAELPGGEELIAATDTRLFRLGIARLDERQRWERRIPRYANSIAVRGSSAIVADWLNPRVAIIDLETSVVRRRTTIPLIAIVDAPGDPLLVGGAEEEAGIARLDPARATVGPFAAAPPAIEAVVDPDGASLWMTVGVRGSFSPNRVSPGPPTRRLRRQWLDGSRVEEFELPVGVRSVRIGAREAWFASDDALVALPLPVGSGSLRVWHPPADHAVRWFDPDGRVAIVVQRDFRAAAEAMIAFDLA